MTSAYEDYEARQSERRADRAERDRAWGDGVYDAWKGYEPDPHHLGNDGHEDDYYVGYRSLE